MAAIDRPLDATAGPVITNFPIWMAETQRIPSLALPDEPPEDVLDLARTFPGTRLMVLISAEGKHWPDDLEAGLPGSECFQPVDLGPPIGGTPGQDILEGRARLRDRLPMSGPYTPKSMEAARGVTGDSRFDGLHAEASAAVGYSANTLRQVRERYRGAYADTLARWQELRDELDSLDGEPRAYRPRLVRDGSPSAASAEDAAASAEADASGTRLRALRGEVDALATELEGHRSGPGPARARRAEPVPDVAVPGARRFHAHRTRRHATTRTATWRCGSWRRRRPSVPASPRRSMTDRPRRCQRPSSRPTTQNG